MHADTVTTDGVALRNRMVLDRWRAGLPDNAGSVAT
jgi:hypothetical protein